MPPAPPNAFRQKHLLAIDVLSPDDISQILDAAARFKDLTSRGREISQALRGRTIVNLFFENSTRTRMSFEVAGRRLGAEVVNFDVSNSSVKKGESLLDTVETVESLGAHYVVMRHPSSGAPDFLASRINASIINAGDGLHEHPTQALLDALTIREALGRLEGLRVAIIGDALHSRVARSNIHCLSKMGARLTLIGPRTLLPDAFASLAPGVSICHDLREGLALGGGVDVVYILRIQFERLRANLAASLGEYRRQFGMDIDRLAWAGRDAIVLHPGPVNRGVEITDELLAHPRCRVRDQVAHGVAVRTAVLSLIEGARRYA
ncbi:MAG: aspartate carbamoyltransferase catalytic subunit [Phycisphaerales bacterium]|nr:aspartate carbamoyltransferase catalytic subunit [Phycisphaerales bacterium]